MSIYILQNESGIVGTTESLDHATIHKLNGGTFKEVLHYESKALAVFNIDGEICIQADDTIATIEVETYVEDFIVYEGRVFLRLDGKEILLSDANLTKDLLLEINQEVGELIEREQMSLHDEMAEIAMNKDLNL
jgi:hypothetical protein